MICSLRYLCLLAISLLVSPAICQERLITKPEDVGVSSEKVGEISEFMQSLVDDGKIAGGVTMMARRGKVVHLEAVGMADREAEKPMTTDAIFRIASMTKPITSIAIMMLVEGGKLKLDDPVSEYIPEFKNPQILVSVDPLKKRPAKSEITIRHLLTHTAGLGYSFTQSIGPIYEDNEIQSGLVRSDLSLEESMKNLAEMPLLFDPGERWEYSLATDVLGRVVEVVSEKLFDKFIEKEICQPLGMHDTFFIIPEEKRSRLVSAYVPVGNCLRKLKAGEILKEPLIGGVVTVSSDYSCDKNQQYWSGGAGLCSTTQDYLRFCQMLLNRGKLGGVRLLKEDTVKMMTVNQIGERGPFCFGFGFSINGDDENTDEQLRDAYGWGGYWGTTFKISPHGDWILITMSQVAPIEGQTLNDYEKLAAEAILD
jgi:CubicO group peptidase (beta-lactamase class C family)